MIVLLQVLLSSLLLTSCVSKTLPGAIDNKAIYKEPLPIITNRPFSDMQTAVFIKEQDKALNKCNAQVSSIKATLSR
jgi:hypothetical protein